MLSPHIGLQISWLWCKHCNALAACHDMAFAAVCFSTVPRPGMGTSYSPPGYNSMIPSHPNLANGANFPPISYRGFCEKRVQ